MTIDSTRYCWVIGNTGFRESALYQKIESYLILLEKFSDMNYNWNENQKQFFFLMQQNGFMENSSLSDVNLKKAARLKTSPLEKLGLITDDRKITDIGYKIIERHKEKYSNEKNQNEYFLENDGDIYIKQLIKMQFLGNNDNDIHPFLLLLNFIKEYKYLDYNELAFILPLIINKDLIRYGKKSIEEYRKEKSKNGFNSYDWIKNYLINHKYKLNSINNLKEYIVNNILEIEQAFIHKNDIEIHKFVIKIDDNGKSKGFSCKLIPLFTSLVDIWSDIKHNRENKYQNSISNLINSIEKTSITQQKEWRKILLNVQNKNQLKGLNLLKVKKIISYIKEDIYNDNFKIFILNIFDILWFIKMYNNLVDYADQNIRYFKLSNIFETTYISGVKSIKISDIYISLVDKIISDLPVYKLKSGIEYFNYLVKESYQLPPLDLDDLEKIANEIIKSINDKTINKISFEKPMNYNYKQWINELKEKINEIKIVDLIEKTRLDIKNNVENNLISCLELINVRNDSKVKSFLDTEADMPTIFEYLVWVSFLILGSYKENPLKFANFSFDNDLKPVQHAGGYMADVIFKYEDHHLMIEATLTNDENQRRLEMEPVPRHLAKYKYSVFENTYCIFIAPYIDPNVAVVFRIYKKYPYYVKIEDSYKEVNNMFILPLSINELISIIKLSIKSGVSI